MLVKLHNGPLDGLQREVRDGTTQLEVPFVIADGVIREATPDEKPLGYWLYFRGSTWFFGGYHNVPEVKQADAKPLHRQCLVDGPGFYVLDNGEVIEVMGDHRDVYYCVHRGILCRVKSNDTLDGSCLVTVKHLAPYGIIVDKGEWGPASIDDLKRVPIAARFGDSKTPGTLVGARFENGAWLWISSDGRQVDVCETVKCLSELPF